MPRRTSHARSLPLGCPLFSYLNGNLAEPLGKQARSLASFCFASFACSHRRPRNILQTFGSASTVYRQTNVLFTQKKEYSVSANYS
ncbi:hypothetical protein CLOM_g13109 [Closterium sp. NIES-68]|nr:hypothetical protein CLOM_g2667 [Closterium sp. NIES-68]GJP34769.1 hypothetical protein CLOM_g19198 [Closterium sp. NIES-68]GJP45510.1 hypothetical protein CLOM_g4893 [Closterium sp. NIES-68]GJP53075.1 hypothetical protein CLOM_g12212 [Closterium sp. NIES-68]GJP53993.1 hypothetical protein CLOM_g13109 [Closterium sp. NIES-68]